MFEFRDGLTLTSGYDPNRCWKFAINKYGSLVSQLEPMMVRACVI